METGTPHVEGAPPSDLEALLALVFPDRETADRWLRTPVPALGGRPPREVIAAGESQEVVGLLAGMVGGAFS